MKPQKQINSHQSSVIGKKQASLLWIFAGLFIFTSMLFPASVQATAGINRMINFQGKVVNKSDGTNLINTTYSFVFKFYDAASSGNQLPNGSPWSESQALTVTDGLFRATLGSVTPIPSTLDFNSDSIYLDITFNSETFTTRVRMTAVPYAFNAEKVGGLTVTNTTGTLTIPSGKTIQFADAFTTSGGFPLTLTSSNTTNATLPSGTITLVDLAATQTLTGKTIGSTGLVFSGTTTDIATINNEDLSIIPNGNGKLDVQGMATVSANLTIGGQLQVGRFGAEPTQVGVGSMYYNTSTNLFRCYTNSGWVNCDTNSGGSPVWSSLVAPTTALSMNMYQSVGTSFATTFTYGNATSTTNLFNITDTSSNNGTGYMFNLTTQSSSTLKPFHVSAAGTEAILVDASGRVGVGNLSPLEKLDVTGNATASGNLTLAGGARTIAGRSFNDLTLGDTQTGNIVFSPGTGKSVQFYSSANNISSAGLLTLASTITANTTNTINGLGISTGALTAATSNTINSVSINAGAVSGVTTLGMNNTFTNSLAASTALTLSGNAAGISFTGAGSNTNTINTSNNNNLYFNLGTGNVGIGSSAPIYKLDVTGMASVSANLTVGGQVQVGRFGAEPTQVGVGSMYYNTSTNKFRCYVNAAWADCDTNSGGSPAWSSLIAPTQALSMNMYQSVGTSFATTFTYGNATSTTNLFNITDTSSNNGTGYMFNLTTAASSTLNPFHVSAAGVESILVDASGRIGLGTTSPISKVQIETNGVNLLGKSALIVNQKESQDILTASASGITRFTVTNTDISMGGHDNNISAPGSVSDTFVYDTAGDMDGGRWTQDERALNSSWYNETLGTATRGTTKPFPRKAVITATATNVYIYDAKDNSLWMKFNQATNTALDVDANNDPTSVFALNGKIYVGATGSAATGLYIIDFTRDQITRFNATDARDYAANISLRNTSQTVAYANQSRTGLALVSSVVNDERSAVINGKTYFSVATNGGANGSVTVINETDQVLVANLGPASIPSKHAFITSTGILYATIANNASPTNYALKVRYNIPIASGNNLLFHEVYGNIGGTTNYGSSTVDNNTFASLVFTAGPAPVDATFIPNSLFVTQGTSIVDGKSNTIYIGNNDNLTIIQEKQGDTTNGLVKYYTNTYISGNLTGDIRAFYPLDTNVGSGLSDISVKGNTLTNGATAPTYNVSGVRNYGASLGASAATAFSSGATLLVPATTPLTVAAWFKPSTLTVTNGTREVFVSADANSANVVSWGLGTKGDGTNANIYCYAGNTTPTIFEVNTNIAAQVGNWYHVVLTSDSSGNLKCYVNGTLSGTGTLTGTAQTPTRFQIGATQATTAINAVRSTVDEVQVTAETASPALVKLSYDTGSRALNGHAATSFRGTAVSADQRQRLNGASAQVNTVRSDLEAGRIYAGTAGGGVTVLGTQSDTINDIFTTSALDETGSAMGSNTINALSIGKGYGTNSFVAIGHGAGMWIETINTNIKDFLANGYNPFGSSLTQSNLNVDTVFKVTNPVTSRLDNIAGGVGTGNQPSMNDIFRVDSNGAYSGLNMLIGGRTDYTQSGFNFINQAAATFGADSSIRGATSSAVFKGKLFVATRKQSAAGVYRYDGGGQWTLVTAAVGKVLAADAAIVTGYAMTVWNNQLVIGTQTTLANGLAGVYVSSNADTGNASTTTWTLLNTTRGTFNTTAAIGGVSDLAVYNGALYLITDHPKKAEIYRYLGGTGAAVFTKVSAATAGAVCASDAVDASGGMFQVAGGRLYVGIRTYVLATARVCYYDGTSTNPDVDWKVLNSTRGTFGGYAGGAATAAMIDVTGMTVYNGELWVTVVKAANSLEIYRLKGNPGAVPAGAANFQRINTTIGRVMSTADTTVSDGAVMKAYQGRMYLGTQTSTDSLGALYEFEPSNADNFTLVNTTRGTFGAQTSVDDVTVLQPYNDPTNPNGGAVLFIGTDDAGGNAGVYSWIKYLSQSNALKMDSGSNNFGSIIFTSDDQTYDNAARSGKFVFSHAVNLSTGAFDYAEDYPTNDPSIEAGDIVAVDKNNKEFVVKGNKNQPVLGVVSENPGFRLSQSTDKTGGNTYIPIALVGRVPVKVTTENGAIKAGDYLTISSSYGIAMKATKAGAVIGQAMEDYDGAGVGKITVYVQTGQINGAKIIDALPGLSTGTEVLVADTGTDFGKRILKQLMKNSEILDSKPQTDISEVFTDRVTAGLEVITPRLITDKIITNSLSIFNEASTAGGLVASIDNKGNATFTGTLSADTIKANRIEGLDIMVGSLNNVQLTGNSSDFNKIQQDMTASIAASIKNTDVLSSRMDELEKIIKNGLDSSIASSSGLTLVGKTTAYDLNIVGKLTTGLLTIESDVSAGGSIQTIMTPLKLQKDSYGNLEIMGTKIVIDTQGNMVVKESITTKELKTHKLTILDDKDATSGAVLATSAGKAEIAAGETSIMIKTSMLTDKSLIFATPENLPTPVAAHKVDSETFEITVSTSPSKALQVSWWIIN